MWFFPKYWPKDKIGDFNRSIPLELIVYVLLRLIFFPMRAMISNICMWSKTKAAQLMPVWIIEEIMHIDCTYSIEWVFSMDKMNKTVVTMLTTYINMPSKVFQFDRLDSFGLMPEILRFHCTFSKIFRLFWCVSIVLKVKITSKRNKNS